MHQEEKIRLISHSIALCSNFHQILAFKSPSTSFLKNFSSSPPNSVSYPNFPPHYYIIPKISKFLVHIYADIVNIWITSKGMTSHNYSERDENEKVLLR